jgi:hybrid cluster-associated redox disulfide protein
MTSKKITKEMNIMEILEINPGATEILAESGLACLGCAMAHAETLEQGLLAHGFEPNEINEVMKKLNK